MTAQIQYGSAVGVHAAETQGCDGEELAPGPLPIVDTHLPIAADDRCHFAGAARLGRRKSDQVGHLVLTAKWLRFHGALEVRVAWAAVSEVRRADGDLLITVTDTRQSTARQLMRFSCISPRDAVRAAAIAGHLAGRARS